MSTITKPAVTQIDLAPLLARNTSRLSDLRSVHVTHTKAAMIDRGILARDQATRNFAIWPLATEAGHFRLLESCPIGEVYYRDEAAAPRT